MPTYRVTDPDTGKTIKLIGDSPPTEQELIEIFTQASPASPNKAERKAEDYGEALLTNLPTEDVGQDIVRGIPAAGGGMLGAIAGAAMGAPFGPIGVIAGGILGAGLGGASGESARQAVSQGTAAAFPEQNYPVATGGEVLRDIGIQGATQAVGQAGGVAIGAAAKAARPFLNKIGAQAMRVGAGIPEKAGMAAMKNPSMLLDAPSQELASEGYKTFERYTGLRGLGDAVKTAGRFPSEGELEKHLFEVAARTRNGAQSTAQELYTASQAASSLKQMGKLGNPRYAMLDKAIGEAKNSVDDALEIILPEYKSLRSDYAASKLSGEFSSLFPLNKNTSPNVLRGTGAAAAAGYGLMSGNPAALAALPLISPMFYGAALRGPALAGRVPGPVYRVMAGAAYGGAGSAVSDAYRDIAPRQ